MLPLNEYPAGSVVPIFFNTYSSDDPSASVTITGLAVTDIEIYKGTSMTQRASDAGYTLLDTDGIDLDGITGIHGFSIDLGDNTDAGFYAVGSFYHVVVSAITVDGATINFVADRFRIIPAEAVTGYRVVDVGAISGDATAADSLESYCDGTTPQPVNATQISGDGTAADNLEAACDGTTYNIGGGAVVAASVTGAVGSVSGHTPQTGDSFARLGAPAGASVSADIAAVKTDTGNLVTRITSTLFSGITSLAQWLGLIVGKQVGNATARTEIRATGAGAGTFDETTDSQEAIRDTAPLGTAMRGTDNAALAAVATEARLAELDAANLPADIDSVKARLPAALVGGRMDSDIGAKTGNVALSTQEKADVNAEVLDVLDTDTFAEPGQEAPGATVSLVKKIGYLYKFLRNKITQTATTLSVYDDAGTTVDQKATVSDDATTYTRGEIGTGP